MNQMRDVVVNVPEAPKPSTIWRAALFALWCGLLLELSAIANEIHSANKYLAVIAVNGLPSDGLHLLEPNPSSTHVIPTTDTQVIHEERGAAVVTMLGKGRDATEFRYAAVASLDGAFTLVVDRHDGVVWQCLGTPSAHTVEGRLKLECVKVYDGPIKGKK